MKNFMSRDRSREGRNFYDPRDISLETRKGISHSADRSRNFYCIQDQKRLIASQLKYLLAASLTRKLDESPGRRYGHGIKWQRGGGRERRRTLSIRKMPYGFSRLAWEGITRRSGTGVVQANAETRRR